MRFLARLLPLLCFAGLVRAEALVAQQPGRSAVEAVIPLRHEVPRFESPALLPPPPSFRPLASLWAVEGRNRPEDGQASRRAVATAPAESSIRRHVSWGVLFGAGAGLVSSLLVLSACGSYCDGVVAEGIALHVGIGALAGGAAGALVYWIRQE